MFKTNYTWNAANTNRDLSLETKFSKHRHPRFISQDQMGCKGECKNQSYQSCTEGRILVFMFNLPFPDKKYGLYPKHAHIHFIGFICRSRLKKIVVSLNSSVPNYFHNHLNSQRAFHWWAFLQRACLCHPKRDSNFMWLYAPLLH